MMRLLLQMHPRHLLCPSEARIRCYQSQPARRKPLHPSEFSALLQQRSEYYSETTQKWLDDADITVNDKVLSTLTITDEHSFTIKETTADTSEDAAADTTDATEDTTSEDAEAADESDDADTAETDAAKSDSAEEADTTDSADSTDETAEANSADSKAEDSSESADSEENAEDTAEETTEEN